MLNTWVLVALLSASLTCGRPAESAFPRPLSRKAQSIYEAVTPPEIVEGGGAPAELIGGYGRFVGDQVGYGDKPVHCQDIYYPAIVSAKKEVVMTTFLFDSESPCAKVANKALIDLNSRALRNQKIRVYMIFSTLSKFSFWKNPQSKVPGISDFLSSLNDADPTTFGLPEPGDLNNLDFRVKTFHQWALGTIHNKLLIVDGNELAIGSKNWDQLPGYEYAARWQGSIARSARKDFERIWSESLPPLEPLGNPPSDAVPMLYLSRVANRWFTHPEENPQDAGWIRALEIAEKEVYIQSPNFTTKTVVDKVLDAVRRGVKVKVVTAYSFHDVASYFNTEAVGNNRATIKRMYEELSDDEKATKNLQVCFFLGKRVQPPKPTTNEFAHVKFMSVDGEFYIFGSGNQDTQSWYNSSESNVLVDDAEDTARVMKRLLADQQSFDYCFHDDGEKEEPQLIGNDPSVFGK